MAGSGISRANENKRIRQEALREQLANGKHIEHVIEIANKLQNLSTALEGNDIQRLKSAAEIKLKLIDKYLPSLKQQDIDHTSSDGTMSPKDVDSKIVEALVNKLID